VFRYNFGRNWFYLFQRLTGVFLFFFILFHLLHYRFGLVPGLTQVAVAGNAGASFDIVAGDMAIPWVLAVYILGVAATAWHLGYGIWLFAVDWGLVIGEKAQKHVLYACMAVAIGLFGVGTNAAVAFIRPCGLLPAVLCEEPKPAKTVAPKKV
jgi:succinate dehydrogenase / fumarate reductase cytochrome b subunit